MTNETKATERLGHAEEIWGIKLLWFEADAGEITFDYNGEVITAKWEWV